MTSQHDAWHHIDVRDAERRWRGAVTTTAVTVTANVARTEPVVAYRNPVALWVESTNVGGPVGADQAEALPAWAASITVRLESGDHCLELLRALKNGVELDMKGELFSFTMLELCNRFNAKDAHPTHLRKLLLHMQLTGEKRGSIPVLIQIEHKGLNAGYEAVADRKSVV